MKLLALECSGLVASVAVVEDDTLLVEFTVNYKKTHSQTLLPMLEEAAKMIELDLNTLDAIAVAGGPGSFTGLRIGSATAKGLGLALDKPIVSVPTVDALACNLYGFEQHICPIMDARRDQVYTGIYHFSDGKLITERPQAPMAAADLVQILNGLDGEVVFLGDGVPVYRETILGQIRVPCRFAPANLNRQRAASVAVLAMQYYREGKIQTAAEHRPEYLRMTQAERDRIARMHLSFSAMLPSDLPEVSAIERRVFSEPWSEEAFASELAQDYAYYLVVRSADFSGIIGYCGFLQSREEANVVNVAVREDCRQKGVGYAMLSRLLKDGRERGVRTFSLEVRESNTAALRLYEKLGFAHAGIRKNFYEKPTEDALILRTQMS